MSRDLAAFWSGNIIRVRANYFQSSYLQDEKDWFSAIELAVTQDDGAQLKDLITLLRPPIEYLQYELFLAVRGQHAGAADCLLDFGTELDATIRYYACCKPQRSADMMAVLLKHGWDINGDLWDGGTPLSFALDDEPLVRWLLEHGASPNISKTNMWQTQLSTTSGWLLNTASGLSTVRVLDLLLSHGADRQKLTLHSSTEVRYTEERARMIELLIDLGVDVNRGDYKWRGPHARGTPLHSVTELVKLNSVRLLLGYGADPTIKNQYGGSSIKYAAHSFVRAAGQLEIGSQVPSRPQTQDEINQSVDTLAKYWLIWHAMYQSCGEGGRAFRRSLRDMKLPTQPLRPEPAPIHRIESGYETNEQARKILC